MVLLDSKKASSLRIQHIKNAGLKYSRLILKVEKCNEDSVDFIVQTTSTLVDKDGNKIKKGDIITIKLDEKTDIRLSKKQAMENISSF